MSEPVQRHVAALVGHVTPEQKDDGSPCSKLACQGAHRVAWMFQGELKKAALAYDEVRRELDGCKERLAEGAPKAAEAWEAALRDANAALANVQGAAASLLRSLSETDLNDYDWAAAEAYRNMKGVLVSQGVPLERLATGGVR